MKTIVCLDFDGVIVDSIKECLTVSKKAFLSAPFEEGDVDRLFYKYRFLVRPAYQYGFLTAAIALVLNNNEEEQLIESRFLALVGKASAEQKQQCSHRFFQAREELRQDEQKWIDLHLLTDFGKSLVGKELTDYCIVTTKDKKICGNTESCLRSADCGCLL